MYLIDTSVLAGYLHKYDNQPIRHFTNIVNQGILFGITGIIYQEILHSASSETDFNELAEYLNKQHFYDAHPYHKTDHKMTHYLAAKLHLDCLRQGVSIDSARDLLIAQTTIEHDLILLHNDPGFLRIANVVPELKIYPTKIDQLQYTGRVCEEIETYVRNSNRQSNIRSPAG